MILRKLYFLFKIINNPKKDEVRLKELQNRKLRKMIRHAYNNVPYYHELFDKSGLKPKDIRTAEDLGRIPITEKEDLISMGDLMLSQKIKINRCRTRFTSGSTGNPHKIVFDRVADDYGHATDLRSLFQNGYKFNKRLLEVTHPRHISNPTIMQRLGLHRTKLVSIFDSPEEIIRQIIEYKPHFLKAYPSVLRMLADKASGKVFGLEKIFTTSELLSGADRNRIVNRLGADVIDLYGSVEFPRIAWECEKHEGYHIDIDSVIVEVIRDGKTVHEGTGDIVVTGLYNKAMPLIRYRIGDIGMISGKERCSCGRSFPLLHSIRGRCNDRIILPSGREVDPIALYSAESLFGIKSFRIIQEKPDFFKVEVVKGNKSMAEIRQSFNKSIRKAAGKDKVRIAIRAVKHIKSDRSGKFRCIISMINKRSTKKEARK